MTLTAENCAGHFDVVRYEEASAEGRTKQVVSRIRFVPDDLAREMTLQFRIV